MSSDVNVRPIGPVHFCDVSSTNGGDIVKPVVVQSKPIMTSLFEGAVSVVKHTANLGVMIATMGSVDVINVMDRRAAKAEANAATLDAVSRAKSAVNVPIAEARVKLTEVITQRAEAKAKRNATILKVAKIAVAVLLVGVVAIGGYALVTSAVAKKAAAVALSVLATAVKKLPFVKAA